MTTATLNAKDWPLLFKMDAKKRIREWRITASQSNIHPFYTVEHGLKDGQKISSSTEVKEGKNIGKANETSSWEQCISESQSLWNKQRDRKGYTETVPCSPPNFPMLAQSYDRHSKKIVYPAYISVKYDGLRCLGSSKGLVSRQGKQFKSIPHIESAVKSIVKDTGITLDGELYVHSESFQEICSAIKRDTPSDKSSLIQYHVYDMISDEDYEVRLQKLKKMLIGYRGTIELVDSTEIQGPQEIEKYWEKFTKEGYEGAMIRNKKGGYEINKRSYNLQKFKKFIDMEFIVINASQNKGKLRNTCSFTLKTKEGNEFSAMPEGSQEHREQLWQDWKDGTIKEGDKATIKFFSWSTSKNKVPRFPILRNFRNYEG